MSKYVPLTLLPLLMIALTGAADTGHDREAPPHLSRPAELTTEQQEQILQQLRQRRPELYEHLLRLKETNPERYRFALAAAGRWRQRWRNLPPEVQESLLAQQQQGIEIWQLARRFHASKDAQEKADLRDKLQSALTELFEAEHNVRRHRIDMLQEEIQRLRQELAQRAEQKDQIIQQRLGKLLEQPPETQGDGEPPPPAQ